MSTWRKLGSKQAHRVIHQPISVVLQCGAGCLAETALTYGKWQSIRSVLHVMRYTHLCLLYFTMVCDIVSRSLGNIHKKQIYDRSGPLCFNTVLFFSYLLCFVQCLKPANSGEFCCACYLLNCVITLRESTSICSDTILPSYFVYFLHIIALNCDNHSELYKSTWHLC